MKTTATEPHQGETLNKCGSFYANSTSMKLLKMSSLWLSFNFWDKVGTSELPAALSSADGSLWTEVTPAPSCAALPSRVAFCSLEWWRLLCKSNSDEAIFQTMYMRCWVIFSCWVCVIPSLQWCPLWKSERPKTWLLISVMLLTDCSVWGKSLALLWQTSATSSVEWMGFTGISLAPSNCRRCFCSW